MNYGVKATKKRIRAVTSRKKKYANRLFLTFFRTAFVLVLFLCVTGVSTFIGMFKGILDSSPDFNPVTSPALLYIVEKSRNNIWRCS